jgi:two-component system, OmpR family, sensor kinase
MKRTTSLTRSLMLSLTGALIAFWLIAIAVGVLVMRKEYDEVFDSALQETGERLLSLVIADMQLRNNHDTRLSLEFGNASHGAYLTYQARNPDGSIILKSHDAQSAAFDAPLSEGFHNTRRYRIYTASDKSRQLFLQVADRFSHRREAVRESAAAMLIPLLGLIPGSFFVIWLIVGRSTRPISILRDAIATKDSGYLAPIGNTDLPREVQPIVHSVNLLLDRLRLALDAEREFTANSAHELRTPIAGALAHCQILIRELSEHPAQNRARTLETALVALGKLAEKLLQLSRADSGIGAQDNATDLLGILDLVVRDFVRYPTRNNQIEYDNASGRSLIRPVDGDAFAIVIRNIIENALIHRGSETSVMISVDENGVIMVTNDCPVVAPEDMAVLKKRFQRGKTQASGSGLGLSIADKIVTQMGGTLELTSPASGKTTGFEVKITL